MIWQTIVLAARKIDANSILYFPTKTDNDALPGIIRLAYFWATVIAVIVLVIAGFIYATSQGDPSKLAQAKNAMLYTVVGLVVVYMSAAIIMFVNGAFF